MRDQRKIVNGREWVVEILHVHLRNVLSHAKWKKKISALLVEASDGNISGLSENLEGIQWNSDGFPMLSNVKPSLVEKTALRWKERTTSKTLIMCTLKFQLLVKHHGIPLWKTQHWRTSSKLSETFFYLNILLTISWTSCTSRSWKGNSEKLSQQVMIRSYKATGNFSPQGKMESFDRGCIHVRTKNQNIVWVISTSLVADL